MNSLMNRTIVILFLACATGHAHAQDLDCPGEVSLNGGSIEVEASDSGDDTDNIQCALDAAIDGGYRDVFLVSGEYSIGPIEATGFVGDLRGAGKVRTSVAIRDSSLSCDGEMGVALRFQVGAASVRNLTLLTDSPCGDGGDATVIAYYSNPDKCSSRTTFGNVDRVAFVGMGTSGLDTVSGVVMGAAPGCDEDNERILGTLKVNRSDMTDLDFGIITSIAGGGQVDVNFNVFEGVGLPLTIVDASQSTTVLNNTFNYNNVPGYPAGTSLGTTAVFIASTENSPAKNSTALKNNKFVDAGSSSVGYGILVGQRDKNVGHSMLLSANTFTGNAANTGGGGVAAIDTNDGLISANRFSGSAATWIDLRSGDPANGYVGGPVSGWAIVANDFSASQATTDISLGTRTSGIIVGKSQDLPSVTDETGNNDVLESSSGGFYSNGASARETGLTPVRVLFDQQLRAVQTFRRG